MQSQRDEVFEHLLQVAIKAAKKGGKYALSNFKKKQRTPSWIKSDGTIVTSVDEMVERIMIGFIRPYSPKIGYLGEECGESGGKDRRWIIDPIDGTDLFVRGLPGWATMLALEWENEIVLGVVYNPVTKELYTARQGKGAFLNGKRIYVSKTEKLRDAFLLYSGINELFAGNYQQGFTSLLTKVGFERGIADCAGWMWVADGRADVAVHAGLGPEDIAAPKIIIEEAGGKITECDSSYIFTTGFDGNAVASNGFLHPEVLIILNEGS